MQRLSSSLAFLAISTLAYAQETGVPTTPLSPSAAGTEGDAWLLLYVIPVILVAGALYFFLKRGRTRF